MNNQSVINEIRSKLDIVDIVSSYIPLSKQGKNYFGVCPFHEDNHPSMSVSREKQIYRCFSCGASGNVFTFVQNYEQISFPETLKLLADKAGVHLENGIVHERSTKYDKFYKAYDLTCKFYQNNLKSNVGENAIKYLNSRGIDSKLIEVFGIGLSTLNNDITKLLLKKDYNIGELNTIGISNSDRDIFIDRIMFPLCNTEGKVIGFSGRRYKNEDGSKYINSKETPIFKKGLNLYNYHRAREEVRINKEVIVMEGFMDVIRASTADVKNVVALMGTAMTHEQANLIKRLSNNVVLCFDGDDAGRHATLVNGEEFEKLGLNPKVIELIDDDDPDTYILKYGKEAFRDLVKNAIYFKDFKIKQLKNNRNLNSDEEKANYINEVLKETSLINDEIRREIIVKNLAIEFNLSYNTLEKKLTELITNNASNKKEDESQKIVYKKKIVKDKYYYASHAIIYYMLTNVEVILYYNQKGICFNDEKFRFLASEISYYYKKYGIINIADFYTYLLDKEELLTLLNEVLNDEYDDKVNFDVIIDYIKVLNCEMKNQEIKRLKEMIRNTSDLNKKIELSEKVRSIKIGS